MCVCVCDVYKRNANKKGVMLKNVLIVIRVIWTRISSQQTQVLKWIVQLEFTWQEIVDL